jgi:hypothetical protein
MSKRTATNLKDFFSEAFPIKFCSPTHNLALKDTHRHNKTFNENFIKIFMKISLKFYEK